MGLPEQVFNAHNLEALCPQSFNDGGEGLDGGRAVAAAVMEKHDVAAVNRRSRLTSPCGSALRLRHYRGNNCVRSLTLSPVIGINFRAHCGVAFALH